MVSWEEIQLPLFDYYYEYIANKEERNRHSLKIIRVDTFSNGLFLFTKFGLPLHRSHFES